MGVGIADLPKPPRQSVSIANATDPLTVEEKPTLTELPASTEMATALLESAAQAIVATDRAGRIVLANRRTEELFGYSSQELLGSSVDLLIPEARRGSHAEHRHEYSRQPKVRPMGIGVDLVARRKDGTEFPVEVALSHMEISAGVFAIAFVSDISQRKLLEQQLLQAQKMDAIGRLAGGVAHDFNNMLMVISGHGEMVLKEMPAPDPLRWHIEEMLQAANRGSAVTRQLLALTRHQPIRTQAIDLNALIANTEKMLRGLIRDGIALELMLQSALGSVQADPHQVEQALVNLVINSRDAMPTGGTITVETADVYLDDVYTRTHAGVQPGQFVMIAVSDTGVGMAADIQQRVFEPFFTTKEHSRGTGLGLATVYGMAKQAGGDIWLYSEPGKGTTFKLYLPAVTHAIPQSPDAVVPTAPRGSAMILVVDDDPSVRDVILNILAQLGYVTLAAACGQEALEIGKLHGSRIDLLLTDMEMPGMNGYQLMGALSGLLPNLKVLYVSGYTENFAVHRGIIDRNTPFLSKPFSRSSLAKAVKEALTLS
jgi:PAS domain S-box-containing protein